MNWECQPVARRYSKPLGFARGGDTFLQLQLPHKSQLLIVMKHPHVGSHQNGMHFQHIFQLFSFTVQRS